MNLSSYRHMLRLPSGDRTRKGQGVPTLWALLRKEGTAPTESGDPSSSSEDEDDAPVCYDRHGDEVGCCSEDCFCCSCMDCDADDGLLHAPFEPEDGANACATEEPDKEWGNSSRCEVDEITRTAVDISGLDVDVAATTLCIESTMGREITSGSRYDLLVMCWALLQDNVDLMEWAVCWATGDTGVGKEIAGKISRTGRRFKVVLEAGACDDGAFCALIGGRKISINTESDEWSRYVEMWEDGTASVWMCAVVDLTCTLFHELMHSAGYSRDDEARTCKDSYLAENIFRWAMFRRYGSAGIASSTCCDHLDDDDVFGSDSARYPDSECLPASSSGSSSSGTLTLPHRGVEEGPTP